jgi:hypothetical protein
MSLAATILPRVDEIPAAVVSLLSVSAVDTLLGGSGRVVRIDQVLPALSDQKVGRLVVFLRDPVGVTHLDAVNHVDVQIRADVKRHEAMNPASNLGRVHAEIFSQLQGTSPSLTYASVPYPLQMMDRPSRVLEHPERGYFFQSATYRMTVEPV